MIDRISANYLGWNSITLRPQNELSLSALVCCNMVLEYTVTVEVRELMAVILLTFFGVEEVFRCFLVSEGKPAFLERSQRFYGSRLLQFSYQMYSPFDMIVTLKFQRPNLFRLQFYHDANFFHFKITAKL